MRKGFFLVEIFYFTKEDTIEETINYDEIIDYLQQEEDDAVAQKF